MATNDEMKYNEVLKALGEVLEDKNTTISCQKWQINDLQEKLAAAEAEIAAAKAQPDLREILFGINKELKKCVCVSEGRIVNAERLLELQNEIYNTIKHCGEGGAA